MVETLARWFMAALLWVMSDVGALTTAALICVVGVALSFVLKNKDGKDVKK